MATGNDNSEDQIPSDAAETGSNGGDEPRTLNVGAIIVGVVAVVVIVGVAWAALNLLPGAGDESETTQALATVNGEPVTAEDVDVELAIQQGVQAQKGRQLSENPDDVRAFRRELLDQLVDQQLMLQAAEGLGITVTDEEVTSELPVLGQEFAINMEELEQFALEAGVTAEAFQDWARRGIIERRYLETDESQDVGLAYRRERGAVEGDSIFVSVSKDDVAGGLQNAAEIRFFAQTGGEIRAANEGDEAPDFSLMDPDGNIVTLSQYRGQPVMVNFWATWCKPCALEMPMFISAYEKNQDKGFVVLAVNVQETPEQVSEYVAENGLALPVVLDRDGQISTIYRVRGLPSTFFIDENGILVEAKRGAVESRADLQELLEQIMPGAETFAPAVGAVAIY
jgi:peroxiredoxin